MPVKFQTYKKDVTVPAGQTLHFQAGKGYYAGPAAPVVQPIGPGPAEPKSFQGPGGPYAPPTPVRTPAAVVTTPRFTAVDPYAALSTAQVDARATALANAGLSPQQAEIRRQQELARVRATQDEAAISGFQTAAGKMMGEIAPVVGAGYREGAGVVGAIGTGVGGQIGQDLAARQAAGDEFARSQGQSGGSTLDAAGVGSTIGYLGGVLPGEELASEGAAAQERAARDVQIPLNAGREELDARMFQAREEQDGYAQQLIQLAAQFPGLKAQALQQLNQYELDKANYRDNLRVHTEQIASSKADTKRQDRAEVANEIAAGISADQKNRALGQRDAEMNYRWASLQFQSQKAVAAAKAAAAKGKRIDTSASKLLGHIVYQDGTEDASIKVKQTTGTKTDPKVKAQANRAKATSAARVNAFKYASTIIGKPIATSKDVKTAGAAKGSQVGQYVAAPGERGVFPPAYPGAPATTNNPNRAARSGAGAVDYNDAQQKVWAEIDGDGLMARYGYSKEQVLAWINAALKRAGWRRRAATS